MSLASPDRRITRSAALRESQKDGAEDQAAVIRNPQTKETSRVKKTKTLLSSYTRTISANRTPPIHAPKFRLIQEKVAHNLYQLLIAAMLWNRTKGSQAKPVLMELIRRYPSPEILAKESESGLALLLQPLGLHNSRARRLHLFAEAWLQDPPTRLKRYRRLNYPDTGCGRDLGAREVLDEDDPREGWEVAHLPGMGPYALDSFRIFYRDVLRGLATDWEGSGSAPDFEPEWKRVVPADKELKAYIRWMWLREGYMWDPSTGERERATKKRMKEEQARQVSLSPELL